MKKSIIWILALICLIGTAFADSNVSVLYGYDYDSGSYKILATTSDGILKTDMDFMNVTTGNLTINNNGYICLGGSCLNAWGSFSFIYSNFFNQALNTTSNLHFNSVNATSKLIVKGLASCDTIDTDANGTLKCGTDATGGGGIGNTTLQMQTALIPNITSLRTNIISVNNSIDRNGNSSLEIRKAINETRVNGTNFFNLLWSNLKEVPTYLFRNTQTLNTSINGNLSNLNGRIGLNFSGLFGSIGKLNANITKNNATTKSNLSNLNQRINSIVDTNTWNTSTQMRKAVTGIVNSSSWNRTGNKVILAHPNDVIGIGASGISAVSLGLSNTATGDYGVALGTGSSASYESAVAIGTNCVSSQYGTQCFGLNNAVSGVGSFSSGASNIVSGSDSSAMGRNLLIVGNNSYGFGGFTLESGENKVSKNNAFVTFVRYFNLSKNKNSATNVTFCLNGKCTDSLKALNQTGGGVGNTTAQMQKALAGNLTALRTNISNLHHMINNSINVNISDLNEQVQSAIGGGITPTELNAKVALLNHNITINNNTIKINLSNLNGRIGLNITFLKNKVGTNITDLRSNISLLNQRGRRDNSTIKLNLTNLNGKIGLNFTNIYASLGKVNTNTSNILSALTKYHSNITTINNTIKVNLTDLNSRIRKINGTISGGNTSLQMRIAINNSRINASKFLDLNCSQLIFNNGKGSAGICDGTDDGSTGGSGTNFFIDKGTYIILNQSYAQDLTINKSIRTNNWYNTSISYANIEHQQNGTNMTRIVFNPLMITYYPNKYTYSKDTEHGEVGLLGVDINGDLWGISRDYLYYNLSQIFTSNLVEEGSGINRIKLDKKVYKAYFWFQKEADGINEKYLNWTFYYNTTFDKTSNYCISNLHECWDMMNHTTNRIISYNVSTIANWSIVTFEITDIINKVIDNNDKDLTFYIKSNREDKDNSTSYIQYVGFGGTNYINISLGLDNNHNRNFPKIIYDYGNLWDLQKNTRMITPNRNYANGLNITNKICLGTPSKCITNWASINLTGTAGSANTTTQMQRALATNITDVKTQITKLNTTFKSNISNLNGKIGLNFSKIFTSLGLINTNTTNIYTSLGKVNTNTSSIWTGLAKVNTNTSNIFAALTKYHSNITLINNTIKINLSDLNSRNRKLNSTTKINLSNLNGKIGINITFARTNISLLNQRGRMDNATIKLNLSNLNGRVTIYTNSSFTLGKLRQSGRLNITTNVNMTVHNISSTDCIIFTSGGKICTGV